MAIEILELAVLLLAAVAVIATDKTRVIQTVAIVELIIGLLLALVVADFLRLPIANVDGVLAFLALVGWATALVLGKNKLTLICATVAAWITGVDVLIQIGWIRIDAIGHLL